MITGRPASVSCTGKVGYETRRMAKEAMRRLGPARKTTVQRDTKAKLQIYGCPYCGYWHVGHFPAAHWEGPVLDYMPDLMELRKRPRLNGPVVYERVPAGR